MPGNAEGCRTQVIGTLDLSTCWCISVKKNFLEEGSEGQSPQLALNQLNDLHCS